MFRKNKRTDKRKDKIKKKTFGGFNIRLKKKAAGKHSAGKRR